jgi:hypothetical protein
MANKETTTLGIRMSHDLHQRLTQIAKREHRSLNNQIIWMIERQLDLEGASIPPIQSSESLPSQSRVANARQNRNRVSVLDWDPTDAGSIILSTYWIRFWRPFLGLEAAALYEHLLVLNNYDNERDYQNISMLEVALGVDRSTIFGSTAEDSNDITLNCESGLLGRLTATGLVVAEHTNEGWHFSIQHRIPILTEDQVAILHSDLQYQHADWLKRNASAAIQYRP